MKILQALFFPPEQPGGVSSMVPFIQEDFKQNGWEMDLFYLPKRIRNKGVEPYPFQTLNMSLFEGHPIVDKYKQTMMDYIWWTEMRMKQDYDVIHAHHPIAALVMKYLFPHTPVVVTIHSSYENELFLNHVITKESKAYQFLTSIYHELEETVDQIIVVSHAFKRFLSPHFTRLDEIKVLYNGFDQKRFRPSNRRNEVVQLVTLCRLVPAKGLDVLIEACSELKKRGHPFMLHIIGDGPIRQKLEEEAQRLDMFEETIFYGYMLHPEQFMPFFDVFVLPSRAESFGNVFAEAALCNLTIVGTEIGGVPEQIEDGVNGLLVPVNDVQGLTTALEKVVTDEAYRQQLADKAWKKSSEHYSLDRVIKELETLYRMVK
ncbi:glycosyltransferase family 4 protein [Longirhabdus pacifica]|uniref:glycosyltransferase family 4 protein n=1 Tax=Longirhabdus pacifica TaxID=2305227 RepID=UPI001008E2A8|nr:glycosyltransferase family 4 protein [Longirhabdus pacifica]